MNLTMSVDDDLLRKAREHARRRGVSLQDLLRGYLRGLVGEVSPDAIATELLDLMRRQTGDSGGRKIKRDDGHEGRS
jgi:hypothetical protein